MDLARLLPVALRAAEEASEAILTVYHSGDFDVEAKEDHSPLTRADKMAHQAIQKILETTGIPVLSEEGKEIPYNIRNAWDYLWMVDPLDGTKEFLKRNGEFTVNIALIFKQRAVLGVVAIPVSGEVFYAAEGHGAWTVKNGMKAKLPKRVPVEKTTEGLRVVASRSHLSKETQEYIGSLSHPELVTKGSSLKFMLLAENKADIYPRFAPTMEWDTAASHAVMNEIGLPVLVAGKGDPLQYNKEDLLNPFFIVG